MSRGVLLNGTSKNYLNVKSPKILPKLKALKILPMYLVVMLLINKISGSENRNFLFDILKNENKEAF